MSPELPVLHGYWRSTAAYRVRIALSLKGMAWINQPVDLVRDGGQQHGEAYRALNPAGLVPTLEIDGHVLTQSLAICEYLDETRPEPPLLPSDTYQRAWVRALALDVACDIHPINNLRVQQFLKQETGAGESGAQLWMEHWMRVGFRGIEKKLAARDFGGAFAAGDQPGLADILLVGQAYNADRFNVDVSAYPHMMGIVRHCLAQEAFISASPEAQPDAPSG